MKGVSLSIIGVNKRFNGSVILENFDLALNPGEPAVLFGHSGCGKSTLLRIIAGLEEPDSGTIRIDEKVVSAMNLVVPPWQRRVGMLFQGDALWPHLTIAEQVRLVADSTKTGRSGTEDETEMARERFLAKKLGIESLWNRFPGDLSGGEARRAGLIRTLAANPGLLLLDEPLAHLDEASQRQSIEVIRTWQMEMGSTLLMVSHESSLFSDWPARHLYLEAGRIQG
ncbi:MAG TPA: ATP-binding cassette domain-containing protein [Candidatus Ozemobacteraceae bacterium]|nr:ATP-binding cassette domain-containing protein [Candidatus Ozemobacteraceae bacterium]